MKHSGSILVLTCISILVSIVTGATRTYYNSDMRFFIADLGPTYPCHPLYERDYTWIESDNSNPSTSSVRYVLEGLAEAGFNGIRLPMWPESDEVNGPDPNNGFVNVDHSYCTDLTTNIINVLNEAEDDDLY